MTEKEFITELKKHEEILNPAMVVLLILGVGKLEEKARAKIMKHLKMAHDDLNRLYRCQKERAQIKKEELEYLEQVHSEVNQQYKKMLKKDESSESAATKEDAEKLINTL